MKNDDQLMKGLAGAYLHIHRRLNRALAQEGTSLARTKMLMFVQAQEGAARAADIAELFDLAPRTVTDALDGMERDGLIVRTADPGDRRVKRVAITPTGARAVAAGEPLRKRLLTEQFAGLSEDERAQLAALLGRLVETLQEK
ncbi:MULTISPECIES: MarR family transcriptional regulator [unclassified Sphingomonas]|uniref:MarR family winged helix-turn-helix transcriptional regulator n=1 Tax=unclassified Sphingomonas TaxID=196159 RepID=UPI0009276B2E|nr:MULTISPECIES: MarR family transcriptional regulator [unclassified Sphingomonas]MBN8849222.1 MarR family transcriptional regulator [Sphingomonas sp.]OJV33514.1 MAG: MarR family transcriptional regulator [Sphingomonas sp. 67-36]